MPRPTIPAVLPILLAACAATPAASGPPPVLAVVEEHHHAWPVWEAARASGDLPPGTPVVHLDAHEDMGEPDLDGDVPSPYGAERAREAARTELTVSEFLVPAWFAGTIGAVTWVVPDWIDELPAGASRTVSVGGEPREMSFRAARLRQVGVPDGPWALDVDLDYFLCRNPHDRHLDREIDEAEYEGLLRTRRPDRRGTFEGDGVRAESIVFVRPPGSFTWPERVDRITDLETGEVRYVRGWICMGEYVGYFPDHRATEAERRARVAELAAFLRGRPPPAVITVARSATSGFVPRAAADALERAVTEMLREVYPGLRRR